MSEVEFAVEQGVAIITLNRPEAKNAMNGPLLDGLREAFRRAGDEPEVRGAILTGAGGAFCAGMDLKAYARGEPLNLKGLPFSPSDPLKLDKPTIAAVEGYCLAGGFELALSCDLIVASETARFGLTEVKRGLAAAGGGLVRLPRQAPWRIAAEICLTGEIVDAERLERFGLINRLTPPGGAMAAAKALAAQIAEAAPGSVALSLKVLRETQSLPEADALARQNEILKPLFAREDAREGARAFAEKRPPVWRGG